MSRSIRLLAVLAVLILSFLPSSFVPAAESSGVCLTPAECVEWCYAQGCHTTTGCDPSTNGCFCDNCTL